jgi:hypothetical protein
MSYDLDAFATLMDAGPFEGDPHSSERARVNSSLGQCFDFAATMTPEARRHIHIRLADGPVIGPDEIEAWLAGAPATP